MRKWLLFATLSVIAIFASCRTLDFVKYRLSPDYPSDEGEWRVDGLSADVEIAFDEWGIPHITGRTEDDLLTALGWVHARDRLFQMELLRRVAEGRISELVGNVPLGAEAGFYTAITTLRMDRVNRTLGFRLYSEELTQRLHPRARKMLAAYARGVNAYIKSGKLPIEFRLLEIEPGPWRPEDSIAIALYAYWGNSSNAEHELIRLALREGYGERAMNEAFPVSFGFERYIIPRDVKDFRKLYERTNMIEPATIPQGLLDRKAATRLASTLLEHKNASPYMAKGESSNGWVVAGSRSASGKPILANDPHMPHTMPGVVYLVHMMGDGYDTIGGSIPGTPAIFFGHNRHIAWGATTTNADTQDIYIEKLDPNDPSRYMFKGESLPFEEIVETVRYKDADGNTSEIRFKLSRTRHGLILNPILGDVGNELPPVAIRWSAWESTEDLLARAGTAKATNIDEFKEALHHHGAPIINWVYADADGHIGYFPVGLIPKRNGWDGTLPVPGWTGAFEWDGYFSFTEAPTLVDPERGYIVTANNKVLPDGDLPWAFSNDALPPYRYMRIERLITSEDKLTADDMRSIQRDRKLAQAEMLVPLFLEAFERISDPTELEREAYEYIASWDYVASPDSVATAIYQMILYKSFYLVYSDQLAADVLDLIRRSIKSYAKFDALLLSDDSIFFDDANTPEVEDKYDILARAWRTSVEHLSETLGRDPRGWRWGRLHKFHLKHPFGSKKMLETTFNYGPFAAGGGRGTVWLSMFMWNADDPFAAAVGPVMRHVVDMAHVGESTLVTDAGQSGWPLSPHYHDMADLWLAGEAAPALLDPEQIEQHTVGTTRLIP